MFWLQIDFKLHIQNFVKQIKYLFPKGEIKIQTKQNTEVVLSQQVKLKRH